jgi:hypothetical protein
LILNELFYKNFDQKNLIVSIYKEKDLKLYKNLNFNDSVILKRFKRNENGRFCFRNKKKSMSDVYYLFDYINRIYYLSGCYLQVLDFQIGVSCNYWFISGSI